MAHPESLARLGREIEACGKPDRFIDEREEARLFELGRELGLELDDVEALLNQLCRDLRWTRELDIAADLRDLLLEAMSDDGVIDRKEFDHCVNYAVSMHMPRKRAMQLGVSVVTMRGLKTKRRWLGLGRDWFEPLRQQYLSQD